MAQCPNCGAPLREPPEPFCPSCGAAISGAVPGSAGPPGAAAAPSAASPAPPGGPWPAGGSAGPAGGSVPWEDGGVGVLAGLVETTKRVLLEPTDFFQRMPVTGGIGRPFTYALVLGYLGVAVAAVYNAVMHAVLGTTFATFAQRPELARYAGMLEGGFGLAVSLILGPVFVAVGLFIGAGITHLCLLLVGGAQRGFEATFRVVCYIQAAAVFSVLPFCGGLIGGVYRIVLAILGLAEAHRISKGTAALAVLLPLLLLCCCCVGGLLLAFGGGLASAFRHMPR